MNTPIIVSESTLTERYQTTVPDPVRKALGLKKREKIRFTVQPNGDVLLSRASEAEEDPAIGQFLAFLAQNVAANPSHIGAIGSDLAKRVQALVSDVEIDLDSQLPDEDE